MRNDSDRLQWQTEKNYIMNTFHNGLRRIQTDSKTAQQYVLLCLALAVAALIMVSGGSGEDVISVVFRPFVNFIRVIAWLAECLGVIYLFGYIPHSWSYYDDFSRAGICNQAHEAPLLVKANRDGNIQQLTFSLKGCPLEYWEDNRTTIESALNVTVLSITQGSNNQLFDLRVVAGCNLMGRLIPWADTYMDDSDTKIVLGINAAGIPVSIDFSQLPHWLLAAATGMGKTQLALLILYQLSQKATTSTSPIIKVWTSAPNIVRRGIMQMMMLPLSRCLTVLYMSLTIAVQSFLSLAVQILRNMSRRPEKNCIESSLSWMKPR